MLLRIDYGYYNIETCSVITNALQRRIAYTCSNNDVWSCDWMKTGSYITNTIGYCNIGRKPCGN